MRARRRKWTNEQVSFLIENYGILTQKEIAEKIGKSWRAVHSYAYKKLGLNKTIIKIQLETERIKKIINSLSPEERGYLAGLIDGEGSITVQIQTKKNGLMITPKISIANTNPKIVRWLSRINLFKVYSKYDGRFPNSKKIYTFETHGLSALPILEALAPHLKGKREQAKILSSFIRLRLSHKRTPHFTKEEIDLVRRLILLNTGSEAILKKLDEYERRWLGGGANSRN